MALTTKRHRTARPTPRGASADHAYLSQCKLCPYGVFAHQPHQWLIRSLRTRPLRARLLADIVRRRNP